MTSDDHPQQPSPATEGGQLNASFDDDPDGYDGLRASGHMARRRLAYFSEVLEQSSGDVLELGCGTGTLLRQLATAHPDRQFTGVEPLANYVDFATERAAAEGLTNVRFRTGTGEELGKVVPPSSAGLVMSVDALHHVADVGAVAREVVRATAGDGRWVAMEPNRVHPYVLAYHVLTPGERTFPVRRFEGIATAAGWRVEHRRNMYIFPSGVRSVPAWAERIERRVEFFRPTAGAVVLQLRPRAGA